MRSFDDFDAFGDAVSGAHLRLACDAVEQPLWTLDIVDLGSVVLQVAFEGGGNLCYGGNSHAGPLLFVPLTHSTEHVVNGEPLDDDSLFIIPQGSDFRIRVRKRAHAWCSIALPPELAGWAVAPASARIACPAGTVPHLRRLAGKIAAALVDRPAGTAAHQEAGHTLVTAALAALSVVPPPRPTTGRPRLDRGLIVRRTMEAIEASPTVPKAADLARTVGVTGRTLLRTIQEAYGVSPKRYLMLRELHTVRRSLCAGVPDDATVADVLTRHGIWEFGRFAARDRRHFGELPSATLRRVRG